jgi:hypothetical protein
VSAVPQTELEVGLREPEGVIHGWGGTQSPLLSETAAQLEESPALVFDFGTQSLGHGASFPSWNCGRSPGWRWSKIRLDFSS